MSILSILIVNYRSERQLAICLDSLADCCIDLDYEIQIINNDQDKKLSRVRGLENSRVKVIQNQSNREKKKASAIVINLRKQDIFKFARRMCRRNSILYKFNRWAMYV